MRELFPPGGRHQTRKTGQDRYEMSVTVPADADGFRGHECPGTDCAPAYFKVKPGTGLSGRPEMYCPYCRTAGGVDKFFTQEQIRYAEDEVLAEAKRGISAMLREAFTGGSAGHRPRGGPFSIEMTYREGPQEQVRPPREEPLRRDVVCPHCTLEQAVFGLASWCSDCGNDIFLVHVASEVQVLRVMLDAVPERREHLGVRVAARDIEDALENVVSVFEAVLKAITRRQLLAIGRSPADADEILRREVRNGFQSVARAEPLFKTLAGIDLLACLEARERQFLADAFEKRHPIAHNLGVVDKAYLTKSLSDASEGREVALHADEVRRALDLAERILGSAYRTLFSPLALPAPKADSTPPPVTPPPQPPSDATI